MLATGISHYSCTMTITYTVFQVAGQLSKPKSVTSMCILILISRPSHQHDLPVIDTICPDTQDGRPFGTAKEYEGQNPWGICDVEPR